MWWRRAVARWRAIEAGPLGDCVAVAAFGWLVYAGLLGGLSL